MDVFEGVYECFDVVECFMLMNVDDVGCCIVDVEFGL